MAIRNHLFAPEEYYHCFNRGTDKRDIFMDAQDYIYFLKSLRAYNSTRVLGKLRLHDKDDKDEPLVSIVTYNLLPNHYHIVLREEVEGGISKYLQRVGGGYTMYFNNKNERSGALFQGVFKSKHLTTDQDLRQVIAYVYKNHIIHNISDPEKYRSSLNTNLDIVRGFASNLSDDKLLEIAEIIKLSRLDLE